MRTGKQKMRCPFCGMIMELDIKEEYFGRSMRCLQCNKVTPLSDFEFIDEENNFDKTVAINDEENTRFGTGVEKRNAGIVFVAGDRQTYYRLKAGYNIIGRNGEGSKADFKITTNGDRRMSREHIVIMVERCADGNYRHFVRLYKKEVNATYINKERIEHSDCFILKEGYTIDLPGVTLEFHED